MHEDSKTQGFAVDNAFRERLVAETKAVGATVMRTHYPMHPYTHELADKQGRDDLVRGAGLRAQDPEPRQAGRDATLAAKELEKNIIANQNHPSVLHLVDRQRALLAARPDAGAATSRAPSRLAKTLDPSRPVGLAVAGYPAVGCQNKAYAPLDVIGINEYFGWYPGPQGSIFDRTKLSAYLDQVRACYPEQAIMITEFGAEANRDGPVEEKGTWAFQQDFVELPPRDLRAEAVAQRRALLGAQRVPRAPGLGGRQPAPEPARCTRRACCATATSRASPRGRTCSATTPRPSSSASDASAGPGGAAARARAPGGARGRGVRSRRRSWRAQADRRRDRVGQRQAAGR